MALKTSLMSTGLALVLSPKGELLIFVSCVLACLLLPPFIIDCLFLCQV